jgi:hypothetical protein
MSDSEVWHSDAYLRDVYDRYWKAVTARGVVWQAPHASSSQVMQDYVAKNWSMPSALALPPNSGTYYETTIPAYDDSTVALGELTACEWSIDDDWSIVDGVIVRFMRPKI